MINIFNIRNGFANNSSSSHSIIFKSTPIELTDNYPSDLSFGWDNFTIGTKDGVLDYLKAILCCNFQYGMNEDYIKCIVKSWVGDIDDLNYLPNIDHQSIISLPHTYTGDAIHKDFFMEFKNLLLSQDTVILGGNDNDGEHPLTGLKGTIPNLLTERSGFIVKKDHMFNYWTFFNRFDGTKFRCVLNEKGLDRSITPTRAMSPDLVDIKITDYCNFNCGFCYQGSTKEGKHTEFNHLTQIIDSLSYHEVLEIAYGGGEPTTHPDFIRILEYTKSKHIVPNFTTKNIDWLKKNIMDIYHIIGSCAVSVGSFRDVKKIASIIDFYEIRGSQKICAQVVMGTLSKADLVMIIKECSEHQIPLTLLGYKTTGRGDKFKQQPFYRDYTDWLDWVKEALQNHNWFNIGIDTALVRQSGDKLSLANIPKYLYHSDEGLFSWYIDAVDKTCGPSSYEPTFAYKTPFTIMSDYLEYGDRVEAEAVKPKKRGRPTKV